MVTKTDNTAEPAKEPVKVEGLEVSGGKVVAVPAEPEVTPPPAQPTPDQAAKAPPAKEEVVANIGHVRVKTSAEKRVEGETATKEDHWLRDAKEAHRDAARLSVVVSVGTEFQVDDLKSLDPEGGAKLSRARLLFDWNDGQGVFHERGKELDLPRNEAAKLIEQGLAERANPPELDPIEKAMAEATINVLTNKV